VAEVVETGVEEASHEEEWIEVDEGVVVLWGVEGEFHFICWSMFFVSVLILGFAM
jgi:hypothetical protein